MRRGDGLAGQEAFEMPDIGAVEPPLLCIDRLSKTYSSARGERPALRDVSIAIESGEFISVVGPSGGGKSTLLRCLAGIEGVSAGRMLFKGEDITTRPAGERNFEWLPQSIGATFVPHQSLRDGILLGLRLRGEVTAGSGQSVSHSAKTFRIDHLLARRSAEVSGGELQRAALVRAMLRNPAVFLLDEPLSSLDERTRYGVRGELKRINKETGVTVICVTHEQRDALSMSTRCLVINDGRVEQFDTPEQIYRAPQTLLVATFFSPSGLNMLAPDLSRAVCITQQTSPSYFTEGMFGVRPEDIVIYDEAPSGIPDNLMPLGRAVITDKEFVGSHYRLVLAGLNSETFRVTACATELPRAHEVAVYARRDGAMVFDQEARRVDRRL
jgi:ABC-type sugar transport system ATPase subunit